MIRDEAAVIFLFTYYDAECSIYQRKWRLHAADEKDCITEWIKKAHCFSFEHLSSNHACLKSIIFHKVEFNIIFN